HHKRGEMALAYALHKIESNNLARLTNYAEYLRASANDGGRQTLRLDGDAEIWIRFDPRGSICPFVVWIERRDVGEVGVIFDNAVQNLLAVIVLLEANRLAVKAGCRDCENQRLSSSTSSGF